MTTIHVLKLGGGAGVDAAPVLRNLAERIRAGERWVVVHGASDAANRLAEQAGRPIQTLTGPGGHTSRYTDAAMIDLYCMAAAAVNQQIVAGLAGLGVAAVGLAGPNVIFAERHAAIRAVRNGRTVIVRDDYSGTVTGIDAGLLSLLLDAGRTPVVAPLALGLQGERLNIDGDLAAAAAARALGAAMLVILSNVPGLLRDVSDPDSLVRYIPAGSLDIYEPLAQGRMKKKLMAARQPGVDRVILAGTGGDAPLDAALSGGGTHIVREVQYAERSA